ncbi:hypothetical protein MLD38_026567 [Melastoma candidum]|uniref:Uncharacterized protein n=1 Tax=Melastoma candidum TaxID=119954 RepID=A0ACB9P411_9MYRT|nr:hypothetical protein MLD38_026567 [Melastoma candidum]
MRQPGNCEMGSDLGLWPCIPLLPCSSPSSSSSSSDATSFAAAPKSHNHHRPHIALLHDGRSGAFDITELQARAILMLARQEAESTDARSPVSLKSRATAYGNNRCYLWSPGGVSMKRSLQRFLQERRSRRARDQETSSSPYNGRMAANTGTSTNHRRHHHHRVDGDTTN